MVLLSQRFVRTCRWRGSPLPKEGRAFWKHRLGGAPAHRALRRRGGGQELVDVDPALQGWPEYQTALSSTHL